MKPNPQPLNTKFYSRKALRLEAWGYTDKAHEGGLETFSWHLSPRRRTWFV
jgi:hypothetical protein